MTVVVAKQLDSPGGHTNFWYGEQWHKTLLLQHGVAVPSPGLFREWVTTERPGHLPLGSVVLLRQLSGRPIVLVCVYTSVFLWTPFKGQRWQTGFNIFSTVSK